MKFIKGKLLSLKNNQYYKNFLMMLSGNTVSQIIPFIIAPIISRIFTPEQFAIQSNFLAIAGLIGIIAAGRYEFGIVLPESEKKSNSLIILSFIIIVIISAFTLGLIPFKSNIGFFYNDNVLPKYIIYISLAVFLYGIYNLFFNINLRRKNFKTITYSRISQSFFGNITYVILGYLLLGTDGLIWGWFFGQIISTIILIIPIKNIKEIFSNISFSDIKIVAKEYKDFPMINSLHAFSDIFATQFFIFWLITNEFGILVLGLFSVMNRYLRAPIQLVTGAVSQIYYKEATDLKNNNQSSFSVAIKTIKICLVFAIPFTLLILIWGPEIFSWYLGSNWLNAGKYAQIMAPALFLNFIFSPISTTPIVYNKQKTAFIITLMGYVLNLGILFLLASLNYSFEIALIGYSLSLSIYSLILGLWYLKLTKK